MGSAAYPVVLVPSVVVFRLLVSDFEGEAFRQSMFVRFGGIWVVGLAIVAGETVLIWVVG